MSGPSRLCTVQKADRPSRARSGVAHSRVVSGIGAEVGWELRNHFEEGLYERDWDLIAAGAGTGPCFNELFL